MAVSAVAHMHGMPALVRRVAALSSCLGGGGGHVGAVTLLSHGRWRASSVVHIGNRRLDREQAEAEHDEAGRQPVTQGPSHGRYLNPMVRALKAVLVRSCLVAVTAAGMVGACQGAAERAGEPIAHRRLQVDTTSPSPALSVAMLRVGDSVFHGQVGDARCSRCHGQRAMQAPAGPDLSKSRWLRVAPYGSVVHFLAHGQRDTRGEDPGTPHAGAAQLSAEELRAVALYVDSLARGQRPNTRENP